MSKEIDYEDVQKTILKAVTIRNARLPHLASKTPEQLGNPMHTMSDNLGEGLTELLADDDKTHQDWESHVWNVSHTLTGLLVLLGKPCILEKLEKHHQEQAAVLLGKLIVFFQSIQTERVYAFLDYMRCGYGAENEELKRLQEYYDFSKRGEHKYHSNFFDGYFREKEYLDNETAFYNKHFKR